LIVNDPTWSVVSVTISWSHRKYQGALAGLGVIMGFAASSRGEGMATARMERTAMQPRVTMAARRIRSGTALTVRWGASRVVARIVGAVPEATPSSV